MLPSSRFIAKIFLFAIFICTVSLIGAGQLTRGRVVAIKDGDTFVLLTADKKQEIIRMAHIDAPEKNQDYGQIAKRQLSAYIFGKDVMVRWIKRDRNQRILGEVIVDGKNINEAMVQDGLAWQYLQFNKEPRLREIQEEAMKAKRGLWQMTKPIAPWEYRKSRKTKVVPHE